MKLNITKLILGFFLITSFLPLSSNASVIVFEEIVCEIKINKKNKTINLTIGKSFKIMEFIKDNNFYLAERMRKKVLSLIN